MSMRRRAADAMPSPPFPLPPPRVLSPLECEAPRGDGTVAAREGTFDSF